VDSYRAWHRTARQCEIGPGGRNREGNGSIDRLYVRVVCISYMYIPYPDIFYSRNSYAKLTSSSNYKRRFRLKIRIASWQDIIFSILHMNAPPAQLLDLIRPRSVRALCLSCLQIRLRFHNETILRPSIALLLTTPRPARLGLGRGSLHPHTIRSV
jgi:hypothetical protein